MRCWQTCLALACIFVNSLAAAAQAENLAQTEKLAYTEKLARTKDHATRTAAYVETTSTVAKVESTTQQARTQPSLPRGLITIPEKVQLFSPLSLATASVAEQTKYPDLSTASEDEQIRTSPGLATVPKEEKVASSPNIAADSDDEELPPVYDKRKPDAKSLKDRFNYASADCAAVVLKANREARGLTAILNSKKDQYMLNECSARKKFAIVELCEDILIDTFVLGNYEFFSSTFKDFMVYASDRYPPKNNQWTSIGHFQAFNSRDAQVFSVRDPKIWAKYVMVEFATHYGQEFYCPLTVFKVYGATQMEQYRKEEEEEDLLEPATLTVDTLAGTPQLDYQLRLPYYRQKTQHKPLHIAGSVSPAKAYLQDMQGLVNEYQVHDRSEPTAVSKTTPMPRVPNLPWDQSNNVQSADMDAKDDYDEDYDEDSDEEPEDKNSTDENNAEGPAPQAPHGQESIFKTIMRRLARVERNITLAYHYLEEQHMIFNLVLQQVELNNLATMQLAIDQLNHTTAKQMQSLTALSEEVWRAILYDLEEYQQKTQTETSEMASRLEFLAEEVLFEKRMNVAQLVLLLTIVVMIAVNKVATKLALIPESKKEK
ncbi:hypothetical protein GGH12_004295 [Coemansia sp. RSA 1822]|nr:hypothetical protein LPJ76_000393 [Coemansia sp. RSA 638]KAJ2542600.1 hypothetical protein GGF49_002746 [Coemansia sp. RSA 1853]KAJ2561054.1 hypothetical protein GGH12_004295 [Coemansia sp. RSA 1822]